MKQFDILGIFSLLSVLAIGGGTAVLPEMKAYTITSEQWITADQFRDIYSLGQLVPGPNMLMVIPLGYHVAGFTGAILAFLGFFAPACLIAFFFGRVWNHFAGNPWQLAVSRGFAPIVVGLMAAGTIAVARTAIVGQTTLAFAAVVFLVLYFGKKINPALLIFAGGVCGWIFLR